MCSPLMKLGLTNRPVTWLHHSLRFPSSFISLHSWPLRTAVPSMHLYFLVSPMFWFALRWKVWTTWSHSVNAGCQNISLDQCEGWIKPMRIYHWRDSRFQLFYLSHSQLNFYSLQWNITQYTQKVLVRNSRYIYGKITPDVTCDECESNK